MYIYSISPVIIEAHRITMTPLPALMKTSPVLWYTFRSLSDSNPDSPSILVPLITIDQQRSNHLY